MKITDNGSFNDGLLVNKMVKRYLENSCNKSNDIIIENIPDMNFFMGPSVPDITLDKYLDRCSKYFGCSPVCFIIAIIYMNQIINFKYNKRHVIINRLNVHRFFCASLTVACKFYEDHNYNKKHYANVGGITLEDLNDHEITILTLLDFNLKIEICEINDFLDKN